MAITNLFLPEWYGCGVGGVSWITTLPIKN